MIFMLLKWKKRILFSRKALLSRTCCRNLKKDITITDHFEKCFGIFANGNLIAYSDFSPRWIFFSLTSTLSHLSLSFSLYPINSSMNEWLWKCSRVKLEIAQWPCNKTNLMSNKRCSVIFLSFLFVICLIHWNYSNWCCFCRC